MKANKGQRDASIERASSWARNNRERSRAIKAAWRSRNPNAGRDYYHRTKSAEARREYRLRWQLKRLYGITKEDHDRMYRSQGGVCAICASVPSGPGSRGILHVDHDHATGKVRGLLCWKCNVGLGNLRDDPAILRAALVYLAGEMREAN